MRQTVQSLISALLIYIIYLVNHSLSQGRKVPILRTGSEESEPEDETVLFEAPGVGAGITAKLGRARDAVVSGISAGLTSFGLRRKESVSSPTSPVKSPPAPETAKR